MAFGVAGMSEVFVGARSAFWKGTVAVCSKHTSVSVCASWSTLKTI